MPQQSVAILGPMNEAYASVLTPECIDFVAHLARCFGPRRDQLLARRQARQQVFDNGGAPSFLEDTCHIRESDWQVAPLPKDLLDRRVEITGPVDRKMVINAFNSGASCYMADFEDSNAPTWHSNLDGQINLRDAIRGNMTFKDPKSGKTYTLKEKHAVLMVRPRGWHLPENHFVVDGRPIPGSLFDFGVYFFNNAKALLAKGSGPYFYLPKMESHLEARLWNHVFVTSQHILGIPQGSIKATVLIETLPAAFEMNEILYELRQHSAGLNCGRWDYIFSYIKTLRSHADSVMPDRGVVTMTQPFMLAYSQLVIKTCHRRGVHAMGGMAAQIPIKTSAEANNAAMEKVKADKLREVKDGHDGTWVAHPALVTIALEIFNEHMKQPNQISKQRPDVQASEQALLAAPQGPRTEATLRTNCLVGVQYLEAWLGGLGCVPLYNLMEDAATAEICRTQVWQWIHHEAKLDNGKVLTAASFHDIMAEEMQKLKQEVGEKRFTSGNFTEAAELFERMSTAQELGDFLTLPAYERLSSKTAKAPSKL
ncbi:hypothetical protein WJX84_001841 [Apatococcus fuscideae]|uniref:Malate synthase n=1 Tax=Apatococcus fuscideae TaxID=2026836 RepID=A0AAW1RVS2_9CHLO